MLKVKPVRQQMGLCGPASLKMVLSYYGTEVTESELAEATNCTPEKGVEIDDMRKGVEKYGYRGEVKDFAEFDDIKSSLEEGIPVIVAWFSEDDGHYSVVVDIDSENIRLIDPELGHVRAMKLEKFYRVWFDFPGEYIQRPSEVSVRKMLIIKPQTHHDNK